MYDELAVWIPETNLLWNVSDNVHSCLLLNPHTLPTTKQQSNKQAWLLLTISSVFGDDSNHGLHDDGSDSVGDGLGMPSFATPVLWQLMRRNAHCPQRSQKCRPHPTLCFLHAQAR